MSHEFELGVTAPFANGVAGVDVASRVTTETFCVALAEGGAIVEGTRCLRAHAFALEAPPVRRAPFVGLVAFAPCELKVATGARP